MPNALFVVPFNNGSVQFPGIPENSQVEFCAIGYIPPPAGTAPYAFVELKTTQPIIDILTSRTDCLYVTTITETGYVATPLSATQRNQIRDKINAMGFTGAQYGLLNAAIQSSQNRSELALAIGTKAFFRDINKNAMINQDIAGGGLGNRN